VSVELSIVVPLYNEADNIPVLYGEICASLRKLGKSYELILVDDGSTDRTPEILVGIADADESVLVITFRRNFGQTAAMAAGIDLAQGAVIVPMDGDLQNDPDDIGALLAELRSTTTAAPSRRTVGKPWMKFTCTARCTVSFRSSRAGRARV
jgi:glycosyltransferase involved in cell wall biosynthesis